MYSDQKITPFLWFNDNAEEAVNFYISLFKNSKILNVSRYGDAGPGPAGSVMTISFVLDGQAFIALNGGPEFTFNEAFSLFVNCDTQEEIDELWAKFTEEGEPGPCGWLKDKFGLSWQIIPRILGDLLQSEDKQKAQAAMQAMLQMGKLDISQLQQAYESG